jgi:hypothetical protein
MDDLLLTVRPVPAHSPLSLSLSVSLSLCLSSDTRGRLRRSGCGRGWLATRHARGRRSHASSRGLMPACRQTVRLTLSECLSTSLSVSVSVAIYLCPGCLWKERGSGRGCEAVGDQTSLRPARPYHEI